MSLRLITTSMAILCALFVSSASAEFTHFNRRVMDIAISSLYDAGAYGPGVSKSAVLAAAHDLRMYAEHDAILSQGNPRVTVTYTDSTTSWEVRLTTHFDTLVTGLPGKTFDAFAHAYQALETFVDTHPVLGAVCWYTNFNDGEHGGGD